MPGGDMPGRDRAGSPAEVESILGSVLALRRRGAFDAADSLRRQLVDAPGGDAGRQLVNRVLFRYVGRLVTDGWRTGWQPADQSRLVLASLTDRAHRLISDAIVAQMREYASVTVDRHWAAQVRALRAEVWWQRDDDYLDDFAVENFVDRGTAIDDVLVLSDLLGHLPPLPLLCPLPGTAQRRPDDRAEPVEQRILDKVRAMLAKAESTDFPDEAEAFTAKAQEFIARHSIDVALLAADRSEQREIANGRRFAVDAPYEAPKVLLLQSIAAANHCQVMWTKTFGFATVFGFDADVDAVELLFASLLVQSTQALAWESARRVAANASRTRSFRQSFLVAYATRIGQRLAEVTEQATRAADNHALVPLFALREAEVSEQVDRVFPPAQRVGRRVSVGDRDGWESGTAAAGRANLGPVASLSRA